MTYDEIILFRRFMDGKGVMNNYEYLYRSHRFDRRELDEYLEYITAENVILSAFDFSGAGNTMFGFPYWKDLDEKWQRRLQMFRETGSMEADAVILCPHCKRRLPKSAFDLGRKGQLHKHCRECETGEWDRMRKEQEKSDKERTQKEAKTKLCAHCGQLKPSTEFYPSTSTADGLDVWCKDCQHQLAGISDREDQRRAANSQETDSGIRAPRLGPYDAMMRYKTDGKSITFNPALSAELREGGFTHCYVKAVGQRQFFVFNNEQGIVLRPAEGAGVSSKINSSDMCNRLAEHFRLEEGDNYYLRITKNLSNTSKFVTVEILTSRTIEAFLSERERIENDEAQDKRQPLIPMPSHQSPSDILQQLIDDSQLTERDIAAFLFQRGWKLQKAVTTYEEFTI